jgi:hypothetical protein
MPQTLQKHSLLLGMGQAAVGLFVGLVVSAFIFGRSTGDLRQKIQDVAQWKAEAQPRIERIDRGGSISFENFQKVYEAEQSKQYKRLEKLEEAISHLEAMELKIERLERDNKP